MALPVLPAKYYLTHFFELIEFLETHYQKLFEPSHSSFLKDFRGLSEDAQCAYVRMINRKGEIFARTDFQKYLEIENLAEALEELADKGFLSAVTEEDKVSVFDYLTKPTRR
ncbi:MAG: hypothetical protein AB7O96_18355, partial [Pseudobdellovibrionaceae bacterium]